MHTGTQADHLLTLKYSAELQVLGPGEDTGLQYRRDYQMLEAQHAVDNTKVVFHCGNSVLDQGHVATQGIHKTA